MNPEVEVQMEMEMPEPEQESPKDKKPSPKPRKKRTAPRQVEILMTAAVSGMSPKEKDILIKALKEENNLVTQQRDAMTNAANEAAKHSNDMSEHYQEVVDKLNKKFRTILVFNEAIQKTVKE